MRLVRRLASDNARFFVHVDLRASGTVMSHIARELGAEHAVRMLPRRPVHWASFSQVEAALEGVRALLDWPEELDYGVLLTGQDYPLRSAAEIEAALAGAEGRSFLDYRPAIGRFRKRVTRRHWHRTARGRRFHVPNRFVPLWLKRPLPGGLEPFTGSGHWCLSRACLEHVAATDRATIESFRHASSPDEALFQTLLVNSPLKSTLVNDDLRFVDWSLGEASPRVLTRYDLDRMLASHCLFARKFDRRVDAAVLDELDAAIAARAGSERNLTVVHG